MHAFLPSSATWLLTLDETITFLSLYSRGYRYIDRNSFETIVIPLFSIRGYCYRNVNNRSLFGFFFFYSWNKRIVCYRNEGIEIHCSKLNNFEYLRNNCSLFFFIRDYCYPLPIISFSLRICPDRKWLLILRNNRTPFGLFLIRGISGYCYRNGNRGIEIHRQTY